VDWWIGGAFLMGLGGVAMDAQATVTGLLILLLGLLVVMWAWRMPNGAERTRQRLEQLREAATILCQKLPSGMILVDQRDEVLFANDQALTLFEGKLDDFQGNPLDQWTEAMSRRSTKAGFDDPGPPLSQVEWNDVLCPCQRSAGGTAR
jgi:PAS domain-containing protein